MNIRIDIELTEDELRHLAYSADNYKRENPRVRWSVNEYKEAARMRVVQLAKSDIARRAALQ